MTAPDPYALFSEIPRYMDEGDRNARRLAARYEMLIRPWEDAIAGARVLDLASHDGRWPYAFAAAGAAHVTAVEGRQELVDQFPSFPRADLRDRVSLSCGDVFAFLEAEVAAGQTYDIVGNLGFFYHTMEHWRLMVLIHRLSPKLIIIDSEFITVPNPFVQFVKEATDNPLNTTAHLPGQEVTLIGIPSEGAMERFAEMLGYRLTWADWAAAHPDRPGLLADYFREGRKRRGTCYLTRD